MITVYCSFLTHREYYIVLSDSYIHIMYPVKFSVRRTVVGDAMIQSELLYATANAKAIIDKFTIIFTSFTASFVEESIPLCSLFKGCYNCLKTSCIWTGCYCWSIYPWSIYTVSRFSRDRSTTTINTILFCVGINSENIIAQLHNKFYSKIFQINHGTHLSHFTSGNQRNVSRM